LLSDDEGFIAGSSLLVSRLSCGWAMD